MKTRVSISFRAENLPEEAATILTPAGCGPDVAEVVAGSIYDKRRVSVYLRLDETDERVAKVFELLKQYSVEVDSYQYDEYSEEDRQNARLLVMRGDHTLHIHAGLSYGTEYDMTDACTNCGTGARQTSPLYVDGDALRMIRQHRAIGSWDAHVIVGARMRKKMVDAGITGISFGPVRVRHEDKTWSEIDREQILIEHVMPPMRGERVGMEDITRCKVCRRGGRGTSPEIPYCNEDLVGMKDFNLTWEWFGEFRTVDHRFGAHRSSPSVLVTPKVMNVFRESGVKTFDWTPVDIAESNT